MEGKVEGMEERKKIGRITLNGRGRSWSRDKRKRKRTKERRRKGREGEEAKPD